MAFIYPRFIVVTGYTDEVLKAHQAFKDLLNTHPVHVDYGPVLSSVVQQGVFVHQAFMVGLPGWRSLPDEEELWVEARALARKLSLGGDVDVLGVAFGEDQLTAKVLFQSGHRGDPEDIAARVEEDRADIMMSEPDVRDEDPPIIVNLRWSCGLAIGPPRLGIDTYECPECPGEGEVAVPLDSLEFSGEGEDTELLGWGMVYCTSCGQQLEEVDHVDDSCIDAIFEKVKRVLAAREKREGRG